MGARERYVTDEKCNSPPPGVRPWTIPEKIFSAPDLKRVERGMKKTMQISAGSMQSNIDKCFVGTYYPATPEIQ